MENRRSPLSDTQNNYAAGKSGGKGKPVSSFFKKFRSAANSFRREESGQVLCEFAVAFPIQLFIFFGIMQLALFYMSTLVVDMAAYRCARSAVVDEDGLKDGEYLTGAEITAGTLLAPLTGRSLSGTDTGFLLRESYVPGWGNISRSNFASLKTRVEIEKPEDGEAGLVTATVEYNQEFIFPFIDGLFRFIMKSDNDDTGTRRFVFGGEDEEFDGLGSGTINMPGSGRGRMRYIGGRPHFAITRTCTLWRAAGVNSAD